MWTPCWTTQAWVQLFALSCCPFQKWTPLCRTTQCKCISLFFLLSVSVVNTTMSDYAVQMYFTFCFVVRLRCENHYVGLRSANVFNFYFVVCLRCARHHVGLRSENVFYFLFGCPSPLWTPLCGTTQCKCILLFILLSVSVVNTTMSEYAMQIFS